MTEQEDWPRRRCYGCGLIGQFSKRQLKKSANQRRCSLCIREPAQPLRSLFKLSGASRSPLSIQTHPETKERVLYTTKSTKGVILSVNKCIRADQLGPEYNKYIRPSTKLAVYLCHEWRKGRDSEWAHYLATLPVSMEHMPHYKDPDSFGPSLLGTMLRIRLNVLRVDYDKSDLPWDLFLWMQCCVVSRAFSLDGTYMLAPFADMANHSFRPNTAYYFDQGAFKYRALRYIPKSHEITISYGTKGNERLYLNYGFTLPGNPFSATELFLRSDDGGHNYAETYDKYQVAIDNKWESKVSSGLYNRYQITGPTHPNKHVKQLFIDLRRIYVTESAVCTALFELMAERIKALKAYPDIKSELEVCKTWQQFCALVRLGRLKHPLLRRYHQTQEFNNL